MSNLLESCWDDSFLFFICFITKTGRTYPIGRPTANIYNLEKKSRGMRAHGRRHQQQEKVQKKNRPHMVDVTPASISVNKYKPREREREEENM